MESKQTKAPRGLCALPADVVLAALSFLDRSSLVVAASSCQMLQTEFQGSVELSGPVASSRARFVGERVDQWAHVFLNLWAPLQAGFSTAASIPISLGSCPLPLRRSPFEDEPWSGRQLLSLDAFGLLSVPRKVAAASSQAASETKSGAAAEQSWLVTSDCTSLDAASPSLSFLHGSLPALAQLVDIAPGAQCVRLRLRCDRVGSCFAVRDRAMMDFLVRADEDDAHDSREATPGEAKSVASKASETKSAGASAAASASPSASVPFSLSASALAAASSAASLWARQSLEALTRPLCLPERERVLRVVRLCYGDITRMAVDAIVSPCDMSLTGSSTVVSRAVHVAAGAQMREATRQLGGVARVGDAKSTLGFRLPAKHVIHTAGPLLGAAEFRAGGVRAITRTYRNCLAEAVRIGARSVAFPAIGAGAAGFDTAEVANSAVKGVTDFLLTGDNLKALDAVYLVSFKSPHFPDPMPDFVEAIRERILLGSENFPYERLLLMPPPAAAAADGAGAAGAAGAAESSTSTSAGAAGAASESASASGEPAAAEVVQQSRS